MGMLNIYTYTNAMIVQSEFNDAYKSGKKVNTASLCERVYVSLCICMHVCKEKTRRHLVGEWT